MARAAALAFLVTASPAARAAPVAVKATPEEVLGGLAHVFPGGVFKPVVGEWAAYRIGPAPYRYYRVSIVGKEQTPKGQAYWMEVSIGPVPTGGGLTTKFLSFGDPRQGNEIQKIYFQLGSGPVQEMDPRVIQQRPQEAKEPVDRSEFPQLPSQDFQVRMTPSGSYRCVRVETKLGTVIWLSPDVPVFRLVGVEFGDMGTLELVGSGKDAVTSLGEPTRTITPNDYERVLHPSAPDAGASP